MFVEAGILFGIARNARDRLKDAPADVPHQEAIIAIVFSTFSLEAFINEIGMLARESIRLAPKQHPQAVATFGLLWEEAAAANAPNRLKFNLAHLAFAGRPYDAGAQPYRDFALLFTLRNAFAHFKPMDRFIYESLESGQVTVTVEPASILNRLPKRILMNVKNGEARSSWTYRVMTGAAALWACETAPAVVLDTLDIIPDGVFKQQMDHMYRFAFRAVE